ncbi:Programmed cell death protein 6 [Gaertneriomyces sp. JEL0708]|nr:Programmed cell death protein 6 [Gaertneriomyces sp. JEL0708]
MYSQSPYGAPLPNGSMPAPPNPPLPPRRYSNYQNPAMQQGPQRYMAFPSPSGSTASGMSAPPSTSGPYTVPPHPAYATPYATPSTSHPYPAEPATPTSAYPFPPTPASGYASSHRPQQSYTGNQNSRDQFHSAQLASVADLERKLQEERDARRKLEEAELARVASISSLEEELRKMRLDSNKTLDQSNRMAQMESRLQYEQAENAKLQERLAQSAILESRAQHDQVEKRRLEERLAILTSTVAELERKVELERESKERLEQQQYSSVSATETSLQNERKEKEALARQLHEVEPKLAASQTALADLGRTKAELEMQIADLRRQLSREAKDEIQDKLRADLAHVSQQLQGKNAEIAALSDRLRRSMEEKTNILNQLHALRLRYEPPPPPVASNPAIYKSPPPTTPLIAPKGADHHLWELFTKVDPYQLEKINPAQLRDILNNGPWPALEYSTTLALHNLYDRSLRNFNFQNTTDLWDLLHDWVEIFREHDGHKVEAEFGYIPREQLREVLGKCGVHATDKYLSSVIVKHVGHERAVGWDEFVRLGARLKMVMDGFLQIDRDGDRWITVNYDQFLDVIMNSTF